MLLLYFRELWRPTSRQAKQDMARQAECAYANFWVCDQGWDPAAICALLHMYVRLWRSRASSILKTCCRPESVCLGSLGGSNRGRSGSHHRSPRRHGNHFQMQFAFFEAGDAGISLVFQLRLWMVGAWRRDLGQAKPAMWAKIWVVRSRKFMSALESAPISTYQCVMAFQQHAFQVSPPVGANTGLWALRAMKAIPFEALYC